MEREREGEGERERERETWLLINHLWPPMHVCICVHIWYSVLLADYFDEFILTPKNDVTSGRTFIEVGGVCSLRGDTALRYVPDSGEDPNLDFSDSIGGARLSNNLQSSRPVCLAFTVTGITSDPSPPLMYSANVPMLTIDSTVDLTIGGSSASFPFDFINAPPTRAQICLDGTNAFLYVNCAQEGSGQPFTVTDPVVLLSVLGESLLPNTSMVFSVSCLRISHRCYHHICTDKVCCMKPYNIRGVAISISAILAQVKVRTAIAMLK